MASPHVPRNGTKVPKLSTRPRVDPVADFLAISSRPIWTKKSVSIAEIDTRILLPCFYKKANLP